MNFNFFNSASSQEFILGRTKAKNGIPFKELDNFGELAGWIDWLQSQVNNDLVTVFKCNGESEVQDEKARQALSLLSTVLER